MVSNDLRSGFHGIFNSYFLIAEDGTWPEEAYSLVADITKGALIYTQVADYTDAGVPLVLCYVVVGPQVRNISYIYILF